MEKSIISAMEEKLQNKSISTGEIKEFSNKIVQEINKTTTDYDALDIVEEHLTSLLTKKGMIVNNCKCTGCKCGK